MCPVALPSSNDSTTVELAGLLITVGTGSLIVSVEPSSEKAPGTITCNLVLPSGLPLLVGGLLRVLTGGIGLPLGPVRAVEVASGVMVGGGALYREPVAIALYSAFIRASSETSSVSASEAGIVGIAWCHVYPPDEFDGTPTGGIGTGGGGGRIEEVVVVP